MNLLKFFFGTGLGFFGRTVEKGLKVHSALAVSGSGEPLGLLHQYTWSRQERKGRRASYKKKLTAQKENQRWLDIAQAATAGVAREVMLVHGGDREADVYNFLAQKQKPPPHFFIRAVQNRCLQHELGHLLPALQHSDELERRYVEIKRRPDRAAYQAQLSLRAIRLVIEGPRHHPTAKQSQPVEVSGLWVEEVEAPQGQSPIRWLLLTSLPIAHTENCCDRHHQTPCLKRPNVLFSLAMAVNPMAAYHHRPSH
ncbi:MAG: hypothetical protein WBA10_00620 [Elainellaceae cyanobacterium]